MIPLTAMKTTDLGAKASVNTGDQLRGFCGKTGDDVVKEVMISQTRAVTQKMDGNGCFCEIIYSRSQTDLIW